MAPLPWCVRGRDEFLDLYLAGRLPCAVLFLVCNIGSMLLTTMISAAIYRDKPTRRQGVGFALGIVAILIIELL